MKVKILSSELVYPLVDTVVGEEPVLDGAGKPTSKLEPILHENGLPLIDLVTVNDVLVKRVKMQEVPVMRQLMEAIPDSAAEPDGIKFTVNVSDDGVAKKLEFVIGRSVFAALSVDERRTHVENEAVMLYEREFAKPTADNWTAGLI